MKTNTSNGFSNWFILKWLLTDSLKLHFVKIILLIVIRIVGTLMGTAIPFYSGKFLDVLSKNPTIKSIVYFSVGMFILWVSQSLVNIIGGMITRMVSSQISFGMLEKITKTLRDFFWDSTQCDNGSYLADRISKDCEQVVSFIFNNLLDVFLKLLHIVSVLYIVYKLSIVALILMITIVPMNILIYYFLKSKIHNTNYILKEISSRFISFFYQQFNDDLHIRRNRLSETFAKITRNRYQKMYNLMIKHMLATNWFDLLALLSKHISSLIVSIATGIDLVNQRISLGNFTTIHSYTMSITGSFESLLQISKSWIILRTSLERIRELNLSYTEENLQKRITNKSFQHIYLNNISYQHFEGKNPTKSLTINYPNIAFKLGQLFCITGVSGAGKTTLLDIIAGVKKINIGEIIVDNLTVYDLNDFKIAFVDQESTLLFDDLYQAVTLGGLANIDMLRENITWLELPTKMLDVLDTNGNVFIKLPSFSQGEKQRLCVARALATDADIVLLDEPTSALDGDSTKLMLSLLKRYSADKVIIYVSHDVNSIMYADVIYNV